MSEHSEEAKAEYPDTLPMEITNIYRMREAFDRGRTLTLTAKREEVADAFAQFAVQNNPYGLSVGIDMAHELADALFAPGGPLRDEAEVKAEALEEAASWLSDFRSEYSASEALVTRAAETRKARS